MKYNELITTNNMVSAATGATAIYLVSKALLAILRSPPFSPDSMNLARLSTDSFYTVSVKASVPGELKRLLMSLSPNLDDDTKRMTLQIKSQIPVTLMASGCTNDDIKLVASFLDDGDKETKTETLNALKAFTVVWKFKIKIQEYVPQIIEIVTSNWDNNLQLAGLKLLNALHIPDHTHTSLRTQLTNFMDILLTANTSTKVQVLKFLHTLIEKEDLLYDIMNCQVPADFLNLFQTSHPGNLLCEMLAFVERLSEVRQSPQYQSMQQSQIANASLISQPLIPATEPSSDAPHRNSGGSFHPLPSTNEISGGSFHPLPSTNEISGGSLHPFPGTNETSGSFHPLPGTNETSDGSFHPLLGTSETSDGSFHPLPGTNDTGHSFYPLERADHSFQPLPHISMVGSERVLEEPMDSFHTPLVARSDENDNNT
ncbi:putative protein C6orf81, partial [Ophiophagus hannah]